MKNLLKTSLITSLLFLILSCSKKEEGFSMDSYTESFLKAKSEKDSAQKVAKVILDDDYCITPKPKIECPTCSNQDNKVVRPKFEQIETVTTEPVQPQFIIVQSPATQIVKEKVIYKNPSAKKYIQKKEVVYISSENSYVTQTNPSKIVKKDCGCINNGTLPCFNASAKAKGLKWSSNDPNTAKVLNSDGTQYTGTENPFEGGYEKQK